MKTTKDLRVIIVGCGIGGLATALSLRRVGIQFIVLEQAPKLLPIGAGIQLSPNAVRVLHLLGLENLLAKVSVAPQGLEIRSYDNGERILWTHLGNIAKNHFGAPYYHAHRADLLNALMETLGMDQPYIRLNTRCIKFAQNEEGVRVQLEDGSVEQGDVLIGTDGIHSMVRTQLFGESKARYSGTAWRGLVDAENVADLGLEKNTNVWWGPHRSMVHYYVSAGKMFNWIGIVPYDQSSIESWTEEGDREQILAEFEGWHPQITGIISATKHPFKWALFDRDPLPSWGNGRVTLLGDSAHSMLPYHAQGAAQCIEDAHVLAAFLSKLPHNLPSALKRYQHKRMGRTAWIQEFSRAAERHFHLVDADARRIRDERLRSTQEQYMTSFPPGQEKIYGYNVIKDMELETAGISVD